MSKMFPFVTRTWNPLGGKCLHECSYCWARKLIARHGFDKYKDEACLDAKQMQESFVEGEYVFVCDMLDLFGPWVEGNLIIKILDKVRGSPGKFLFLTKNPSRYQTFIGMLQKIDCVLGATIETNRDTGAYSKALEPVERWESFFDIEFSPKFVSIEPIMDFDLNIFSDWLFNIGSLESVAVGYDNYGNHLPEPSLAKTEKLIAELEQCGIKVFRKTLREAWDAVE